MYVGPAYMQKKSTKFILITIIVSATTHQKKKNAAPEKSLFQNVHTDTTIDWGKAVH